MINLIYNLVFHRIYQEKLKSALDLKSTYESGYWNVNSVALGGLGKDPDVDGT